MHFLNAECNATCDVSRIDLDCLKMLVKFHVYADKLCDKYLDFFTLASFLDVNISKGSGQHLCGVFLMSTLLQISC